MSTKKLVDPIPALDCAPRAAELMERRLRLFGMQCDRIFAGLAVLQWLAAMLIAASISPRSWNGTQSTMHEHLFAAIVLGGLLTSAPICMVCIGSGMPTTRQVIAVSQMLWSALLIHITGGRIETHFHVFGSLAFLAWYRDWRVLLTATLVTGIDHVLRGALLPQSIFGVSGVSSWRSLEHVAWVLFEDIFLLIALARSLKELRANCLMQAEAEQNYHRVEAEVCRQTAVLLGAKIHAEEMLQEVKQAEQRVRASETFLERVGQVAGVGGWQLELATQTLFWTAQTCRVHDVPPGYRPSLDEAIAFYAPQSRPIIASAVREGMERGTPWDLELAMITATGRAITVRAVGEVEFDYGKPVRLVGAIQDITSRKAMEDELRSAARTDKLTGLPNRAMLGDRLQQAVERAKRMRDYRFAVLFLDFDRFKTVNDSLGHDMGDLLLQEIAKRLNDATRIGDLASRPIFDNPASDNFTARLGGDEFVVLLDGMARTTDALIVADRLLTALCQPYHLGKHEVYSTASIGIVTSDMPAQSAEEVLRDADTAMYEAKLAGKGQYVLFDVSMRQRVQAQLNLENDLRKALPAGQLFLMYQPIVSLRTGAIESFEALVRWQHPQRGLVSPGEFIPIAEDTGLILPIGEWVLGEACRQFARWRREMGDAAPRSISVNLSRRQLLLPTLPEVIFQVLERTGIPPQCLHLEVTESAVMTDATSAVQMLHEIKGLGVKLAMDDFGTGYSSLSCLHDFPLDVLKIDRSFVANIDRGRDFAALAQAVAQLARNLNIAVVAEGIETVEQAVVLQSLECEFGQGYLFSKPLRAADVVHFRVAVGVLPGEAEVLAQ